MTTQLAQNVLDYWYSVEFFNHYDLEEKIKDVRGDEQREFFISSDKLNRDEWSKHEGKTRHVYLLPFDVSQITTMAAACLPGPLPELNRLRDEEYAPEGLSCFAKLRVSAEGVPDFKGLS